MAAQREWAEKDFYKELGVSSDASADEIKKAYRKLARELHPDAHPDDKAAEERFKRVTEAHHILGDPESRREYDELRAMVAAGGAGRFGGFGAPRAGAAGAEAFDISDLFGGMNGAGGADGGLGDVFGNLFGQGERRGAAPTARRSARGRDVETAITLDFRDAALGASIPIRITTESTCLTCEGTGSKTSARPHTCATCSGSGYVNVQRGSFAMTEQCPDCRGTGEIVDNPCPDCRGTGVVERPRSIKVNVPAGVKDGQKIRLGGQGAAGLRGARSGDLLVAVSVRPDPVFTREEDNLTLTVPVGYEELALGGTVSVPTLTERVSLRIAPGTPDGKTLRVRGRGVARKNATPGDLMVTLKVAVPKELGPDAAAALSAYAAALKTQGFSPRGAWKGA